MYKLMATLKSGKPSAGYYTYIDEVAHSRLMGRPVTTEVKVRAMKWGSLMEVVLFNLLGLDYEMTHKKTIESKKYPLDWSGTPDLITPKKIGEIKAYEPKKFSSLSVCLNKKDIGLFKQNFKQEYWQCVSNAVLCGVKRAEIIVYMPYLSELKEIIQQIEESNFLERNNLDPTDYYFMTRDNLESLAYLPDNSVMSNINSFEFEVPKEDIRDMVIKIVESKKLIAEIVDGYKV